MLIYVLFSPLIIDPEGGMLPHAVPFSTRDRIVDILFASYPLALFLAAPILGELSDRWGRRPLLLYSTIGTTGAYILSAIAILVTSLPLLFLSRILAGLAAGNMTVAQATVADLTTEKTRPRYMALFAAVGGGGWVIAPYFSSLLTTPTLFLALHVTVPCLIVAFLFFCISAFILFKFQETHPINKKIPLNLFKILHKLLTMLKAYKVSTPLLLSIVSVTGWMLYYGFMPTFLEVRFQIKEKEMTYIFFYFSIWWMVGGLVANRWLLKKFSPTKTAVLPLFLVPLFIFSFLIFKDLSWIWFASGMANFFQAITISCFFALFSTLATKEIQGKAFGLWNAGFALTSALSPFIADLVHYYQIFLPFTLAALVLFGCALFYSRWQSLKI